MEPLRNWLSLADLPDTFVADTHTKNIIFDEAVGEFYLGSDEPSTSNQKGFHHIITESFKLQPYDTNTKDVVADINGERVEVARPFTFNNKNGTIVNDVISCSDNNYNNGFIVQKQLQQTAGLRAYIEWEFVNPGPITDAEFQKVIVGVVEKSVINTNAGAGGTQFAVGSTDWGGGDPFGDMNISQDDGYLLSIEPIADGTADEWANGSHVGKVGIDSPLVLTTDWNIQYGDKLQVYAGSTSAGGQPSSTGTIEVVIVRHNNILAQACSNTWSFTTFTNMRYYITMGDSSSAWRVSKNPSRYLGTIAVNTFATHPPDTYVLNLPNG